MNRDSFLSKYKESYLYLCPYFLDPKRWAKTPQKLRDILRK